MHLITLKDWSSGDIHQVVERGLAVKSNPQHYAGAIAGRTVALLFQKTSTRTRCAGEIGATQLGGHALYLDWQNTNFGLANLGDEFRVLSSYSDFIVARLLEHADILRAAEASQVPLMNGCCNRYHPLQALTDLMTLQESFGKLEGLRLTYVGVLNNVANSLIAAGVKVGMHVTCICPEVNAAARLELVASLHNERLAARGELPYERGLADDAPQPPTKRARNVVANTMPLTSFNQLDCPMRSGPTFQSPPTTHGPFRATRIPASTSRMWRFVAESPSPSLR